MSKHTSGPWGLAKTLDMMGNTGIPAYVLSTLKVTRDSGLPMTKMIGFFKGTQDTENEANARLIAAAPDMLEVVERMASNETMTATEWVRVQKQARAAIAKAKGLEKK